MSYEEDQALENFQEDMWAKVRSTVGYNESPDKMTYESAFFTVSSIIYKQVVRPLRDQALQHYAAQQQAENDMRTIARLISKYQEE